MIKFPFRVQVISIFTILNVVLFQNCSKPNRVSNFNQFIESSQTEKDDLTQLLDYPTGGETYIFEDFDGADYDLSKWFPPEGNAFGSKPARGNSLTQQQVTGFVGLGLVNTFNADDSAIGSLRSRDFQINNNYIGFYIGGGANLANLYVALIVNGKLVKKNTGRMPIKEALRSVLWDVSAYRGQKASIHIVDNSRDAWGHINVDHIVFSDSIQQLYRELPQNPPLQLGLWDSRKGLSIFDDFETGMFAPDKWESPVGQAFIGGPLFGHQVGQQEISGYEGTRLINTFFPNDSATGQLYSKPFVIKKRYLGFKIGGGNDLNKLNVSLTVDNKAIFSATGRSPNSETLHSIFWDLKSIVGKSAKLVVTDNSQESWGHILVDQITFADDLELLQSSLPANDIGSFKYVYQPIGPVPMSSGNNGIGPWYINDHTVVFNETDQRWHLFGITNPSPKFNENVTLNPFMERELAHASSPNLFNGPWTQLPSAMTYNPALGDTILWAPHVLFIEGIFHMFVNRGGINDFGILHATATPENLGNWKRNQISANGTGYRDPFIMQYSNYYIMYYTATDIQAYQNRVECRTSKDLIHWSEPRQCFSAPNVSDCGLDPISESPFVIRRGQYFYLFVGGSDCSYNVVRVYRSKNPFRWEVKDEIDLRLPTHAAEIIRDHSGQTYLTRSGWGMKGLAIAPLTWIDGGFEGMEPDTDRSGGDYRSFSTADELSCQKACLMDATCKAWTFTLKTHSEPKNRKICWLKDRLTTARQKSGVISGTKK